MSAKNIGNPAMPSRQPPNDIPSCKSLRVSNSEAECATVEISDMSANIRTARAKSVARQSVRPFRGGVPSHSSDMPARGPGKYWRRAPDRTIKHKKTRCTRVSLSFRVSAILAETLHWCPRGDSNPYDLRRYHLKVVRLPVPPPGQVCCLVLDRRLGGCRHLTLTRGRSGGCRRRSCRYGVAG